MIDRMWDGDGSLALYNLERVEFSGMSFCFRLWSVFEVHFEWQSLDSHVVRPIEV